MNAQVFDIQRASTVDGPGMRTTVFFKGCNLHCAWCHNPESQRRETELLFYRDKCVHCGACERVCPHHLAACTLCGRCAQVCPQEARTLCGKAMSVSEILRPIEADRLFYAGGGGATFSGGECMLQIDFLTEILCACADRGIHTAVDTAGHVPFALFNRILPYADMFLYDIKIMDTEKHKKYTGVGNELILSNLAALLATGKRIWVRVPIVPGVNDTVEEMEAIRAFFAAHGQPEQIELLPYHRMGEGKAEALGRQPERFDVPDPSHMDELRRFLSAG